MPTFFGRLPWLLGYLLVQSPVRQQSGGLIRALCSQPLTPSPAQSHHALPTLVHQRRLTRRLTTGPPTAGCLGPVWRYTVHFRQPGPSHPAAGVRLAPTLCLTKHSFPRRVVEGATVRHRCPKSRLAASFRHVP